MKYRTSAAALALLLCLGAAVAAPTPAQTPTPAPTPAAKPSPPPAPTPAQPDPAAAQKSAEAQKKYDALLAEAKKAEGAVDFKALRFAFFETPAYNPLAGMLIQRNLWGVNQGNYAEAVKQAESVLEKNYVDVNAHMVACVANRQLQDEEKAKLHRRWADGLLESIKSGGDGKSPDTAWHVISISEEYAVLRSLNLRPAGQSLVNANGHSYDAMKTVDPRTNTEVTYFFNVDKPFSAYGRK